ncbi:DsbA family protein [Poseidonocella sedimentorum]|uniref:DSBA-like thioredoxin domain-containing protein n=1 Tax=Poseidonocella sedimentorum TaxID=871652 RepID=A0A1I6CQK9_9RHOB|nr:DsbA family protein [Poseidonocella sedimentorum]SFQ95409.1 DSBA-like thioredoxin domain-containing protein [Poseidonocella sedimentorum]
MDRREALRVLGLGALVAGAYGGTALLRRLRAQELALAPIPGLPGFRRVDSGAMSASSAIFAGLEGAQETSEYIDIPNICDALFTHNMKSVPVAYFSDARCAVCAGLSPELVRTTGIALTHHSLPLLGEVSRIAARAEEAAGLQGAREAFHSRLMGSPLLPGRARLSELAEEADIDPDRLLRDMEGAEVAQRLAVSATLAKRFGFYATPGLVIGRTAVLGRPDIERLVALERGESSPLPC